jgi:hypothetical protein
VLVVRCMRGLEADPSLIVEVSLTALATVHYGWSCARKEVIRVTIKTSSRVFPAVEITKPA